jgi:hypothetical protein
VYLLRASRLEAEARQRGVYKGTQAQTWALRVESLGRFCHAPMGPHFSFRSAFDRGVCPRDSPSHQATPGLCLNSSVAVSEFGRLSQKLVSVQRRGFPAHLDVMSLHGCREKW